MFSKEFLSVVLQRIWVGSQNKKNLKRQKLARVKGKSLAKSKWYRLEAQVCPNMFAHDKCNEQNQLKINMLPLRKKSGFK